tara:strand:- start:5085 stop:5960 length:876 start_codon:yes stop_codon:yes gene_type:complete
MTKIIIEKAFRESTGRVLARLQGELGEDQRPRTILDDVLSSVLWKDLEVEADAKGVRLEDRARYFYDSSPKPAVIDLKGGTYKDFVINNRFLELLQKDGKNPQTFARVFDDTATKVLGLHTILKTTDGSLVFERRSDKVLQAKGYLDLPAGGVMPSYYPEGEKEPNLYVSAQKQIKDELGVTVEEQKLTLLGIVRDNATTKNASLVFEAALPLDDQGVLTAFTTAKDRYESDCLAFVKEEGALRELLGNGTRVVAASLGALLLKEKRVGMRSYEEMKVVLADKKYDVLEVP